MWSWGRWGWRGLQTGICSREERKKGGSGTQCQSVIHTHMRAHTYTHTLFPVSLSERVSQWMVVCGVCVCVWRALVGKSPSPSFIFMIDGRIISFT